MKNWFKNNSESLNWKLIGWLGAGLVIFGYYLNANEYILSWLVWLWETLWWASILYIKKPIQPQRCHLLL